MKIFSIFLVFACQFNLFANINVSNLAPKSAAVISLFSGDNNSSDLIENKPNVFNFSEIIEFLKDRQLYDFIRTYLIQRYSGLVGENSQFESVEQYVEDLLASLVENGLEKTRQKFFEDEGIKANHERLYQRNMKRKYDFDSLALSEILSKLKPGATVLDAGAGFNTFLPHLARFSGRDDISYHATDPFVEGKSFGNVSFSTQPDPYVLPQNPHNENGLYDVIIFRAAMHHVIDLKKMIEEIKRKLMPGGKLVLIEDSFDDEDSSIWNRVGDMSDPVLNKAFEKLSDQQKLDFEKFNDWHANHLYHKWTMMALPFNHKSLRQWISSLSGFGMKFSEKFNMGFPNNDYAIHQPFTLIMSFESISHNGQEVIDYAG